MWKKRAHREGIGQGVGALGRVPKAVGGRSVLRGLLLGALALGFLLVMASPARCGTPPTPGDLLHKAEACAERLKKSPEAMRYRHNWLRCIQAFERVSRGHPRSPQAPVALYQAGELYLGLYGRSGRSADLDEALSLLTKLVDTYPQHRFADDAQYKVGEIYYRHKDDPGRAYQEFLNVTRKFPQGDMQAGARARLAELAVMVDKKETGRDERQDGGERDPGLVAVRQVRHWSAEAYTRVVIDLDGPAEYEKRSLEAGGAKGRRLQIEIKGVRYVERKPASISVPGERVPKISVRRAGKGLVQVDLEMAEDAVPKVFHLYDPFRIVVDVKRAETGEEEKASEAHPKAAGKARQRPGGTKGKGVSLARQLGLTVHRVVVDPGHGGKDPGCYSPSRFKEKDLTLSLARQVADILRREMGCEVLLTRDKDVFLPLERRTAIANMKKADLFLSLHVNANKSEGVHGIETYFLNLATDESAMLVAARENATSEKGISELQGLLKDLLRNTKIQESRQLAQAVQKGLVTHLRARNEGVVDLGVKQAPFYVLLGAQMPSILVETGFLTNPPEARRLMTRAYQEQIARGICKGIMAYKAGMEKAVGSGGR